jgi:ComF family protein
MSNWSQLRQDFLSLFLQENCPLCGRSAEVIICDNCDRQLNECQFSYPKFQGKGKIPVLAWGKYEGLLKRAIAALKYEKQSRIARPLGKRLGETWVRSSAFPSSLKPVVVPIPLHPEKQKQRGYNQAELIARSFCAVTAFPLQPQALKRIKNTPALFSLAPEQREEQVTEAFVMGKGLKPQQNVILLDDIYTTGSTVQAARITLQKAGMTVIGVCAIAKP